MPAIDASTISVVLDAYPAERARLIDLLRELNEEQWALPTECPAYSVKGIATHILGDDLSLLSRQRDGAAQGLVLVAESMPGADFRQLLDAFNDQWVEAARFLSPKMLMSLLELAGEWTHDFYRAVDPESPGEAVLVFGGAGDSSPYWQPIAREYLERWAHHSQIRRALGLDSLADSPFLDVGADIVATIAGTSVASGDGTWAIGPLVLGDRQQAADILTLAHTAEEIERLVDGPSDAVTQFAARLGRR